MTFTASWMEVVMKAETLMTIAMILMGLAVIMSFIFGFTLGLSL